MRVRDALQLAHAQAELARHCDGGDLDAVIELEPLPKLLDPTRGHRGRLGRIAVPSEHHRREQVILDGPLEGSDNLIRSVIGN